MTPNRNHPPVLLNHRLADTLESFGGFLRCEECGQRQELGDIAGHLSTGWPTCHGYTMRWWTQRQIDAGEVPDAVV